MAGDSHKGADCYKKRKLNLAGGCSDEGGRYALRLGPSRRRKERHVSTITVGKKEKQIVFEEKSKGVHEQKRALRNCWRRKWVRKKGNHYWKKRGGEGPGLMVARLGEHWRKKLGGGGKIIEGARVKGSGRSTSREGETAYSQKGER